MPKRNGISLIELVAVALLIGILAATIVPRLTWSAVDAREHTNAYNIAEINRAVERYTIIVGVQPDTIDDLDTPDYLPGGIPENPVNGQPYTLDPVTKRADDGS